MNAAEILAELSKLDVQGRTKIFDRLCELQEQDLLDGHGPTESEKKLLNEALAGFERDGAIETPWRDVISQLILERRR